MGSKITCIIRIFWIKFCNSKFLFEYDIYNSYALKMITVISKFLNYFSLSRTHKYPNFAFSSWTLFLIASLYDFLPNQTQDFPVDYIYELLLLSKTPQDNLDTTVFKAFISPSVLIETAKISYSKKDVFHSTP